MTSSSLQVVSLIDSIPQELLFNISTYGMSPPSLSPRYIYREVNNLNTRSSTGFPWCSEWLVHHLRKTDPFYLKYHRLIELLNKNRVTMTCNRYKNRRGINFSGHRLYDVGRRILELHPEASCIDDSWTIPEDQYNDSDVLNCLFLLDPRPSPGRYNHRMNPERRELINGAVVSEDNDYPYLIHHITPEGLHLKYPIIFPRVPTDTDIIQSLILQGDYNLGELLNWLTVRCRVISLLQERKRGQVNSLKIDGTCIRLYELVRDGVITFIYGRVIYMDSKDRRIYKLLLGLRTEVNIRETDYGIVLVPKQDNYIQLSRRLMRAYGIVRMCMVYYSTDLENKARLM